MKITGTKGLVRRLEAAKARLSKERDTLRNLISDYEDILESCDTALADLESAADTLSQYM